MQDLKQKIDIDQRTYGFALRIVKLTKKLPRETAGFEIGKQLLRSGTSIAANVEEAQGAFSKDDFAYKINIALKEAREVNFWLRLVKDSALSGDFDELEYLIKESVELRNILATIVKSAREKKE